jgi:hypothetical protein
LAHSFPLQLWKSSHSLTHPICLQKPQTQCVEWNSTVFCYSSVRVALYFMFWDWEWVCTTQWMWLAHRSWLNLWNRFMRSTHQQ